MQCFIKVVMEVGTGIPIVSWRVVDAPVRSELEENSRSERVDGGLGIYSGAGGSGVSTRYSVGAASRWDPVTVEVAIENMRSNVDRTPMKRRRERRNSE